MDEKQLMIDWMKSRLHRYKFTKLTDLITEMEEMNEDGLKSFVMYKLKPIVSNIDIYIDLYCDNYDLEDIDVTDRDMFKGFLVDLCSAF